jgi:hypothetical protein
MEFDIEDIMAGIDDGVAGAAEVAAGEALQVEALPVVEEMAAGDGPLDNALANNDAPDAGAAIRRLAESGTSPFWKAVKEASWFVTKGVVGAGIAFGIMYGLNKAIATKAKTDNVRGSLTDYLKETEKNWVSNGLPWTAELKTEAATAALTFPWIDCTK